MLGARTLILTLALVGGLFSMVSSQQAYWRRVQRMRAQPLVDLIEETSLRIPGVFSGSVGVANPAVAAADAKLAQQVQTRINSGVPANGWGNMGGTYEGSSELTPLMAAAMRRFLQTARLLIAAGADLNATDSAGRTALIWAVKHGDGKIVEALVSAGADPNVVDRRGLTAIDYAYAYHWDGVPAQEALLRPLKRVHAPAGPYAVAKRSPFQRFVPGRMHNARWSTETSGDGIRFLSTVTYDFQTVSPPVLTRKKCGRIRAGMRYPEVAAIIGQDDVGGEMLPDYNGWVNFNQGKRHIKLYFWRGQVAWKWASGL
jgi:hypothetical protein